MNADPQTWFGLYLVGGWESASRTARRAIFSAGDRSVSMNLTQTKITLYYTNFIVARTFTIARAQENIRAT